GVTNARVTNAAGMDAGGMNARVTNAAGMVSATDGARVLADPARIERAVANVVRNAILYTPSGGSVKVEIETAGGADHTVKLHVIDTCGGLSAQDLERMFDPGWRGSASRTPQAGAGIGVGLTITQAIVAEAGGSLHAENHQGGCRVSLILPVHSS
ncbi:MAG: ATP-binding protein, partial [Ornithinimicrobium sp.]